MDKGGARGCIGEGRFDEWTYCQQQRRWREGREERGKNRGERREGRREMGDGREKRGEGKRDKGKGRGGRGEDALEREEDKLERGEGLVTVLSATTEMERRKKMN